MSPTSTVAAVTASVTMASQTHTAVTEARNLDDNEDEQSERNYSDSLVTQGSVSPLSSVSSITPGKMRVSVSRELLYCICCKRVKLCNKLCGIPIGDVAESSWTRIGD